MRLGHSSVRSAVLLLVTAAVVACSADDGSPDRISAPATEPAGAEPPAGLTGPEVGRIVVDGVEHQMTESRWCRDPFVDDDTTAHGGQLLDLRLLDSQGNVFRATASWVEDWHVETLRWFVGDNHYQEQVERPWDETGWFTGAEHTGRRLVGSGELTGFDGTEGSVIIEFDLGIPEDERDCPRDPFHFVPAVPAF